MGLLTFWLICTSMASTFSKKGTPKQSVTYREGKGQDRTEGGGGRGNEGIRGGREGGRERERYIYIYRERGR